MKKLSVIMGIIAMTLVAIPSYGADIIFKVPVELVNLSPEVKWVTIGCSVYSSTTSSGSIIGGGVERIDVDKDESGVGSLIRGADNPVVVEVNMKEGHHISEAVRYMCRIATFNHQWVPTLPNEAMRGQPIWALADPAKPFVNVVRGTLPWARTQ